MRARALVRGCTRFRMQVSKCVSNDCAADLSVSLSLLIHVALSKAQDGRTESGREIKERERSHRRRQP